MEKERTERYGKRRWGARRWPPALFILPLLLKTTAFGITQNISVIMFFTVLEDCFRKMFQIKMSMFVLNWAQVYRFRSIFPWIPDLTFFILHGCKSCLIKVRIWHNCADLKPQFFLVCFSVLCIAKCMAKF